MTLPPNTTFHRGFVIRTELREDGDFVASIRPEPAEYELCDIQPTEIEAVASARRHIDHRICRQVIAARLPAHNDHSLIGSLSNLRVELFQLESALLFHHALLEGWYVDISLGVTRPVVHLHPQDQPREPVMKALSGRWSRVGDMQEGSLTGFEEVTVLIHDEDVEMEPGDLAMDAGECVGAVQFAEDLFCTGVTPL